MCVRNTLIHKSGLEQLATKKDRSSLLTDDLSYSAFFRKHKWVLWGVALVIIYTYSFQVTNYTFSIDDEALWDLSFYVALMRYGIVPLKLLLGSIPIFGPANDLLGVVFLVFSGLVFIHEADLLARGKLNHSAVFFFLAFYCSFPFNSDYFMFSTYCFEVSVGLLLVAMAVKFTNDAIIKEKKKYYFPAVFFLGYALSIYQSFLSLYIMAVCASLLLDITQKSNPNVRMFWLSLLKCAAVSVVAFIFYYGIGVLCQTMMSVQSNYLDTFIRWGTADFGEVVRKLVSAIKNLMMGNVYPDFIVYCIPITFIIVLLLCIHDIVFVAQTAVKKVHIVLCLAGITLSPFLISVAAGELMPLRVLQDVKLFVAYIWMFLFLRLPSLKAFKGIRWPVLVTAAVLLCSNMRFTSQLFFSDYQRLEQEKEMMTKITMRIDELGRGDIPVEPVVFVGRKPTRLAPTIYTSEYIGMQGNFFRHLSGRIINYLHNFGYPYINANPEQYDAAVELAKDMPFWPDEGSVAYKEGLIIVNFSPVISSYALEVWNPQVEVPPYLDIVLKNTSEMFTFHHYLEQPGKTTIIGNIVPKCSAERLNTNIVTLILRSQDVTYAFATTKTYMEIPLYTPQDELIGRGFMAKIDHAPLDPGTYTVFLYVDGDTEQPYTLHTNYTVSVSG